MALTPRGRLTGFAGHRNPSSRISRWEPAVLEGREHTSGRPKTTDGFEEENNYFSTHANKILNCESNKSKILEEFDGNNELKAFLLVSIPSGNFNTHSFIHLSNRYLLRGCCMLDIILGLWPQSTKQQQKGSLPFLLKKIYAY